MSEPDNVDPRRRREDWMPEPSNFELARRIDDVRDEVRDGMRAINVNIAALKFVSTERYLAEQETMRQRIGALQTEVDDMKEDSKWIRRTLVGAVLTIVVQLIIGGAWLVVNGIRP